MVDKEQARAQLARDAKEWQEAEEAHQEAIEKRRKAIIRAHRVEGLSLATVAEPYGVTRQYIGRIVTDG